ncbi:MAG: hypothetical protein KC619_12965, partial [Myxococcales bacterium]|nr:hypothetical protein [Myxococcales bacterium]
MRARAWSLLVVLLPGCGAVEYGAIQYGDEAAYAPPQYVSDPDPEPGIGTSPTPAQSRIEIEVFFRELAPYGDWIGHPSLGQVFVPTDPTYRPYRNGHWAQDGEELVWVSYDAIGWAVCHYGSWTVLEDGRWAWVPGTEWAPAWVEWRESEQYVGWAPQMVVVQPAPDAWLFVEAMYLLYDAVASYSVQPSYLPTLYASGRPMGRRPDRG